MQLIEQSPDGGTRIWDTDLRQYVEPQSYTPDPTGVAAFDTSPFANYLTAAYGKLGIGLTSGDFNNGIAAQFDPATLNDPAALKLLFDTGYNGRGANINPYGGISSRDGLRAVATRLGLSEADADRAALDYAQQHYNQMGGLYSEGTHPGIIADEVARRLFEQAGKSYTGLTPEQRDQYINAATLYEQNFNDINAHDWQKDAIGGGLAFFGQTMQDRWETLLNDPERAATPGPISTWIQNKVLNKDNDPVTDIWGGPTKQDYQEAHNQGMETGGAEVIQWATEAAAAMLAGQALTSGFTNAGLTPAQAAAASGATTGAAGSIGPNAKGDVGDVLEGALLGAISKGSTGEVVGDATGNADIGTAANVGAQGYKYWKAYESGDYLGLAQAGFKEYGGKISGALSDAATYTQKAVGDFNPQSFSGGDSPYNANSFFDETKFGNNFAGDNTMDDGWYFDDYSGEWVYGGAPDDQTTFGDDYGMGYGQGNDIFGGGNLEDTNPELFGGSGGGGSGGSLPSLGGLFSGLGSGVSSLLGGASGGGNNLIALAPILAAIQHARQQGPFDTSRLTGLADRYSPDAMAYQYDRNTEDQRRSLTSSLADRGVMGSSFGNMDISNFNTNRELGRGALISQASLGGADIAQKILNAQIQQRQQQNQLYGSSLYALGNVFGGRRA